MNELYATIVFLFVLFTLLGSSIWIGLALMGVAWVGMELFTTRPAGDAMITTIWTGASSWTLTALPLFIWMGEILYRTRLSEDMFRGLAPWMRWLPGGLLHTNIAGCTIFAAVSGSSAATLTTVGKMSIPELRKRGYPEHMIIGTLAGAATLGLMIPPSLTLIVYGVTINESITKLFMAGIFPGLMLAGLFMTYIMGWHFFSKGQRPEPEPAMSFGQMVAESRFLIPVLLLVTVVIGSMYLGYATATEAAAVGVIGALSLAWAQGSLGWSTFAALAAWIDSMNMSPLVLIIALTIFYVFLGMFLDGISSVVLTMAIVEPMIRQAGIDVIWFGIFIVVVVEMAQVTPPIGFNLFVLQGMTRHEISYIAKTAVPMVGLMLLMVVILVIWPEIATWLPDNIRQTPGG